MAVLGLFIWLTIYLVMKTYDDIKISNNNKANSYRMFPTGLAEEFLFFANLYNELEDYIKDECINKHRQRADVVAEIIKDTYGAHDIREYCAIAAREHVMSQNLAPKCYFNTTCPKLQKLDVDYHIMFGIANEIDSSFYYRYTEDHINRRYKYLKNMDENHLRLAIDTRMMANTWNGEFEQRFTRFGPVR